jgi:hypothetical protein
MLKRKIQKVTSAIKKFLKSGKETKKLLMCKECDRVEVEVGPDIAAVTCAYCVQRQVPPPEGIKPKIEGEKFPRGWALKATYIHTDGRIFEKGKDTGRKYEPTQDETPVKKKSVSKKKKTTTKKKVVKKKNPKRRN